MDTHSVFFSAAYGPCFAWWYDLGPHTNEPLGRFAPRFPNGFFAHGLASAKHGNTRLNVDGLNKQNDQHEQT